MMMMMRVADLHYPRPSCPFDSLTKPEGAEKKAKESV